MKSVVFLVFILFHLCLIGQVRIKVVDAGTNLGMEHIEVLRKDIKGKIIEKKVTNNYGVVEFEKNSGRVVVSLVTNEYSHFPFDLEKSDKHQELIYFMYPSDFLSGTSKPVMTEKVQKKKKKKKKSTSSNSNIEEVFITEEVLNSSTKNGSSEKKLIEDYPDVEAEFPGGTDAMKTFLAKTIQYPRYAMEMGDQGKVFVEFVVERDGSLTQIKILRGVSNAIDYETVRVIKNMPAWSPAESKGEIVRARCRIPINYILK